MKAVIQRVSWASVAVNGETVGEIEVGLLILLGIAADDEEDKLNKLAEKVINLRIFSDAQGKMNLSVEEVAGEILVVSQFTLIADTKKGNRPSFVKAADPGKAQDFYNQFVEKLKAYGIKVATGRFQATMDVSLVNDGPVTIILEI